jgi:hypothetical protein
MGEPTARIGRERRRRAAHELCEHFGNMLGIARGDRRVMDHGIFVPPAGTELRPAGPEGARFAARETSAPSQPAPPKIAPPMAWDEAADA